MSWSDALKGVIGDAVSDAVGQLAQDALPDLMKNVLGAQGLGEILSKLQAGGLSDIVASWLNDAVPSLPVSAEQIKSALGEQYVQDIAKSLGLPIDSVLGGLAQHLPAVAASLHGGQSA